MEREPTEAMLLDLEEERSLRKVVGDAILGICNFIRGRYRERCGSCELHKLMG